MDTKSKHKVIKENERINAVRDAIFPEATGRLDFKMFRLSSSRSKYWFKIKMLAVADKKAKKTAMKRSGEGKPRKMLPKPKQKIHPSQLSILAISRYSLMNFIFSPFL
jgi:hypothetical protein